MKKLSIGMFLFTLLLAGLASAQDSDGNGVPDRYAVAGVVKTFALGKAAPPISSENKALLDQVAAATKLRGCLRLRIVGTADVNEFRSQHELQNSNLADRRCNAIRNEFQKRGVPHVQMDCAASFYDTPRNDRSVTIVYDFEQCMVEDHHLDIESLKDTVMGHGDRINAIDGAGGRLDKVEQRVTELERRPQGTTGASFAAIEGGVGLGVTGIGGGDQSLFFLSAQVTVEWNVTLSFGIYGAFLTGVGSPDTLPEATVDAAVGYYFGGAYGVYLRLADASRLFVGGQHLGVSTHHPGYTDFWLHSAVAGYEHVIGDEGPDDHMAFFVRAEGFVGNAVPTKTEAFVAGGGSLILGAHF